MPPSPCVHVESGGLSQASEPSTMHGAGMIPSGGFAGEENARLTSPVTHRLREGIILGSAGRENRRGGKQFGRGITGNPFVGRGLEMLLLSHVHCEHLATVLS